MPRRQKPESGQTGANKAECVSYYPGGSAVVLLLLNHWTRSLRTKDMCARFRHRSAFFSLKRQIIVQALLVWSSCTHSRPCTRNLMLSTVLHRLRCIRLGPYSLMPSWVIQSPPSRARSCVIRRCVKIVLKWHITFVALLPPSSRPTSA